MGKLCAILYAPSGRSGGKIMNEKRFWSDPERVERFARREPDLRLRELVRGYPHPAAVRVLDLGCAGGRNCAYLARKGFDVFALDAAPGMVERVRTDLAAILGPEEALGRVLLGRMDDLSRFEDDSFDLVVALGIYHIAASAAEQRSAFAETARVLAHGGRLLCAVFGPGTTLPGGRLPSRPLAAADLDKALEPLGLTPLVKTRSVTRENEDSRRVVANGLYVKA